MSRPVKRKSKKKPITPMSVLNLSTALPSGTHGKKPKPLRLKKSKEQLQGMSVTTMIIQAV